MHKVASSIDKLAGLAVLGVPLLIVVSAVINGLVLKVLWGWFMVTTFGLPTLSISAAIGSMVVVDFLIAKTVKDEPPMSKVLAESLLMPLIFLGMGWVVQLFM